jgi:hypothetical protein
MEKFKFSITDNTTFQPQEVNYLYANALLSAQATKYFKPIVGIKYQEKLFSYNPGNLLKAADCAWNPTGEGTLGQKIVSVCDLGFQLQYCVSTFNANAYGQYLREGSNNEEVMPDILRSFVSDEVIKKVSNDISNMTWNGGLSASYPNNLCTGLIAKMTGDTTVAKITSVSAITAGNVFAEMQKVYSAITSTIKARVASGDVKLFVGADIWDAYQFALGAVSSEKSFVGPYTPNFLGLELVYDGSIPARTMVAGIPAENMLILTDLLSDYETLRALDMQNLNNTDTLTIAGRFKFGVDYFVGSELVLYSPLV